MALFSYGKSHRGRVSCWPDVAWLLRYLFTEVLDGRNASLTDGVQHALGRPPPRDFRDFAREAAASGVWR